MDGEIRDVKVAYVVAVDSLNEAAPSLYNVGHNKNIPVLFDQHIYNFKPPVLYRSKYFHKSHVIMSAMASKITSLMIVYWSVYSGAYQRKHQSSASLAFVRWIYRWTVNSPHKGPVTREMLPFDDIIMLGHRRIMVK